MMKNVYAFILVAKIVFDWIVSKIKGKALKLHYFRGEKSFATKNYQHSQNHRKGEKKNGVRHRGFIVINSYATTFGDARI